ncbi:transposase family protein [Streptomyces sp. NPDC005794]|uniref:transposase family protein n=1 Tax=Streptomyces sp. NPDC005794 TaxID=3364733 RepID=UPI0036C05C05
MVDLLAARAPGLLKVLREHEPEYVLLDGTLADYSYKHRRHGVNVQVVTGPAGQALWISPALPGRCHDLTAARTHRIIRICERQACPYWPTAPTRAPAPGSPPGADSRPAGQLSPTQQTVNRALAMSRAPVERVMALLKSGESSEDPRISPDRMTSIAKAVLALERQR